MEKDDVKAQFPRVQIEVARGKTFYYYRHGKGKRVRLPSDPSSKEFSEAYKAALSGATSGMPAIATGTVEWLVESYRRSPAYRNLSPLTRCEREYFLKRIVAQSGSTPYASVTSDAVATIVREYQNHSDRKKARRGRNWLWTMKALFRHAVEDLPSESRLKVSPCDGVRYPKVERATKEGGFSGHLSWTNRDIESYRKHWKLGTRERFIFELAMFTGLRRADLVRVGSHHIVKGVIEIPTQKSKFERIAYIPMTDEFQAILDESPVGEPIPGEEGEEPTPMPWIVGARGRPITANVLGDQFMAARKAANVKARVLHGIRRTSAETDFLADVSIPETMAKHGWSTPAMAFHYGQGFDRRRLALAGAEKRKAASLTSSPNDALTEPKPLKNKAKKR